MKKNYYLLLLAILFTGGFNAFSQNCADPTNIYTFTFDGKNYEIVKENKTWESAAACANERGGYLTQIDSDFEQKAIFQNLNQAGIEVNNTVAPDGGGASYVWIGGNDIVTEGKWIWDGNNDGSGEQFWEGDASGNPVGGLYNNWGNEPDNWSNQDGLGLAITDWPLGIAGQWNDIKISNNLYYVIEYDVSGVINPDSEKMKMSVYPNPSSKEVAIKFASNFMPDRIIIYNQSGAEVYNKEIINRSKLLIDISSLKAGVYYISALSRKTTSTEKLVIAN
jgi:hypothetical protein